MNQVRKKGEFMSELEIFGKDTIWVSLSPNRAERRRKHNHLIQGE